MNWPYFTLVSMGSDSDTYRLVDEDGQTLMDGIYTLVFANHQEAEEYLEKHGIRGTVR